MSVFPSPEWMEQYRRVVNSDPDVRKYGQWFDGTIVFDVAGERYSLRIRKGEVTEIQSGSSQAIFSIEGPLECWEDLVRGQNGNINRAFRHKKLKFSGNMVEAMRNWKLTWFLGLAMARVNPGEGGAHSAVL